MFTESCYALGVGGGGGGGGVWHHYPSQQVFRAQNTEKSILGTQKM